MIRGVHAMFYGPNADELRAFVRDKLRLPACDVGEGWLIFDVPKAELGIHPTEEERFHEVSFWCDDLEATEDRTAARCCVRVHPRTEGGSPSYPA